MEAVFELDTADRMCPTCGGALRPMTGQFDESGETLFPWQMPSV